MTQPTVTLPTGSGVNTPASVSTIINTALAAETAYIQTLPFNTQVADLAAGIDDPSNAQALGAPAIIRGTIYAHLVSGVTVGAGQTTAVRTANTTALNAAILKAGSIGKYFEIEPNTYEIYGSLLIPAQTTYGIEWHGTEGSLISQFQANVPVITLGDTTGANTLYGLRLTGVSLQYGVSQTGNTGAVACICGPMAWCVLEWLDTTSSTGGAYPITNPPYTSWSTGLTGVWFNNVMRDCHLYGGQQSLFVLQMQGSGNLFSNIYMSNGTNNDASESVYGALNGPAMIIGNPSYSTAAGNVFERINIESVKCYQVMVLQEAQSFTLIGMHFENLEITASNGSLIQNSGSNGQIIGMDTYDIQVASGLTNISVLANSGSGEMVTIDGLRMGWSGYSNPGLLSPMTIIGTGGNNDQNATVKMRGLVIGDTTGNNTSVLTLYNGLYPLSYNPTLTYSVACGELKSDQVQARTDSYQPLILTATYTHYGAHTNAVLMVPASMSAACTITLSNKLFAAGLGSSLATATGNTVRVRRMSGTAAYTLTVKDAASGGTLTTNTTSAADFLYQFNGTNWVTAT